MLKQSKGIYTPPEVNVTHFIDKDVFMLASGESAGIFVVDRSWNDFFTTTGGNE